MVSDEELRRIYNLFTDCWRYFKKYVINCQLGIDGRCCFDFGSC